MSSEKGQLGAPKRLRSSQDVEDFEQEVDQFLLASVASGYSDAKVGDDRAVLLEFSRFLARPLWTAEPADADRFLALQRRNGLARSTVVGKVGTLAQFYDFLLLRYQGDIHALTGYVVVQPIDEYNRPAKAEHGEARVPLRIHEVQALFDGWRQALPQVRKYLPAARDYLAASLWRRAGLRINETVMLDIRDWPSDLGEFGKLHVRFGKGSRGRGVRPGSVDRKPTSAWHDERMPCQQGRLSLSRTQIVCCRKAPVRCIEYVGWRVRFVSAHRTRR